MKKKQSFWLPTVPYSLTDAVNRAAAATGSVRYAKAAHGADYNGHSIFFTLTARGYWTAHYTWAGPRYIARGTLAECLAAAKRYHERGVKGSSAHISVDNDEDAAVCREHGFEPCTPETEAAHYETWRDARFDEVHYALREESQMGIPCVSLLLQAADLDDYQARKQAAYAARRGA